MKILPILQAILFTVSNLQQFLMRLPAESREELFGHKRERATVEQNGGKKKSVMGTPQGNITTKACLSLNHGQGFLSRTDIIHEITTTVQ